jgi:hypothetical protein
VSNPGKLLFFSVAVCLLPSTLFALNQTSSQAAPATNSNSPAVVMVPASPTIYVVAGGIYGTGVYVVPAPTLPVPSTGISLNGRAGISLETPLETGGTAALPATLGLPAGTAAYGTGELMNYRLAGAPAEASEAAPQQGRLINDLGPSYYVGATGPEAQPAPSLGEIAARYKAERPANVRLYTNADAERIVATVKTGSSSATPPQDSPQQNSSTASAQNLPQPPPSGPVSSAATQTGPGRSLAQSQDSTPSGGPTTPQIKQQAQTQPQGSERLPATSTLLPLFSLLGLLSGGAGLWLMRLRK